MLSAEILNPTATLNDFDTLSTLPFIPGAKTTLVIRINQALRTDQLRYSLPDAATVSVTLYNKDGTTLALTMTAMTGDRSIWYSPLTSAQTEDLAGGNFTFDVDVAGDASVIEKGWVENGLALQITGSGC